MHLWRSLKRRLRASSKRFSATDDDRMLVCAAIESIRKMPNGGVEIDMKVILSRKGFDSANGGVPSPIMPDGGMLPFPIPSWSDVMLSDLRYGRESCDDIYSDLVGYKCDLSCHLDPDLDASRHRKVPKGWMPAFGQAGPWLGYLSDTVGVGPGDLFLFFGWYHAVEKIGGSYRYVRDSGDFYRDGDLHTIWGYLQVVEILRSFKEKSARCPWHPHSDPSRKDSENDSIFVARKRLSFAPSLPGAGLLPFDRKRVLTQEGATRGVWKSNPVYMPGAVVGERKNSAKGSGLYYSGIWQELALRETKAAERWARNVIL